MATNYSSNVNLNLGSVPNVEDKDLYDALLSIHTALETLATRETEEGDPGEPGEETDPVIVNYVADQETTAYVASDYTMPASYGTLYVSGALRAVDVVLPVAALMKGRTIKIFCVNSYYPVRVLPFAPDRINAIEQIANIYKHEALTLHSDGTHWWLM